MPRKKGSKNKPAESKIVKAFLAQIFTYMEKQVNKLPKKLLKEFKNAAKIR